MTTGHEMEPVSDIHVDDIARAHLAALGFMECQEGHHAFNLGNGEGFSILEVIRAAERVIGRNVTYEIADRRPGVQRSRPLDTGMEPRNHVDREDRGICLAVA